MLFFLNEKMVENTDLICLGLDNPIKLLRAQCVIVYMGKGNEEI